MLLFRKLEYHTVAVTYAYHVPKNDEMLVAYMLVYWYLVYLHKVPSTLTSIVLCTGRRRRYLGVHTGTFVFVVPRFMGMEVWPSALKTGIL